MKATVRVAGLLNPAIPSSGEMTPVITNVPMMRSATKSMLSFSVTKRSIADMITIDVMIASTRQNNGLYRLDCQNLNSVSILPAARKT